MGRLTENTVLNIKNKSHAVTAMIEAPSSGCRGVIVAQGGAFGGWSLCAKDGKPAYCYNLFGLQRFKVYGDTDIPEGEHQVRMEFNYDGGGLGRAARSACSSTATRSGRARSRRHSPCCSQPTRPLTSAPTAPHQSATTTTPQTVPSPA
ncbi:MAG: hypothetical protein ACRDTT_22360, partial [Pseudonocardiaceae bacterium]